MAKTKLVGDKTTKILSGESTSGKRVFGFMMVLKGSRLTSVGVYDLAGGVERGKLIKVHFLKMIGKPSFYEGEVHMESNFVRFLVMQTGEVGMIDGPDGNKEVDVASLEKVRLPNRFTFKNAFMVKDDPETEARLITGSKIPTIAIHREGLSKESSAISMDITELPDEGGKLIDTEEARALEENLKKITKTYNKAVTLAVKLTKKIGNSTVKGKANKEVKSSLEEARIHYQNNERLEACIAALVATCKSSYYLELNNFIEAVESSASGTSVVVSEEMSIPFFMSQQLREALLAYVTRPIVKGFGKSRIKFDNDGEKDDIANELSVIFKGSKDFLEDQSENPAKRLNFNEVDEDSVTDQDADTPYRDREDGIYSVKTSEETTESSDPYKEATNAQKMIVYLFKTTNYIVKQCNDKLNEIL